MDVESIVAWALPSLGLLLWAIVLAVALPRILGRFVAPGRLLRLAIVGAYAALFAVGLWLWAVAMPFSPEVRAIVTDELEPWFWGTLALIAFIIGAYLLLRFVLGFLADKARTTSSSVDDAVLAAVRKPAHVLILFAGIALWIELVPTPASVSASLGTLGEVVLILVVALFTDGVLIAYFEKRKESSRVFATAGGVLQAMTRVVIFVFAALMILAAIGMTITPIIASLGVGSLAIGLALQSTLEDFISGLLIAADQPVTVGDFIELTDHSLAGTVVRIGWRSTRIQTLEQTRVIVPNAVLARATIINRSRPSPVLRFQASVGVHYDSNLDRVRHVVHEVALAIQRSHPHATADFTPVVTFVAFNDSSIDLKVWLEATDWIHHFLVHDAFIRRLHERFAAEGIVIPFPIRTLDIPPAVQRALDRLGASPTAGVKAAVVDQA